MPNMLCNFVCTLRKPVDKSCPKAFTDDVPLDCTFTQISAAQKNWAKFNGVYYEYKICVVLSDVKRVEVTEDWRVRINGTEYSVKEINHKFNNVGYDHTTLGVTKI